MLLEAGGGAGWETRLRLVGWVGGWDGVRGCSFWGLAQVDLVARMVALLLTVLMAQGANLHSFVDNHSAPWSFKPPTPCHSSLPRFPHPTPPGRAADTLKLTHVQRVLPLHDEVDPPTHTYQPTLPPCPRTSADALNLTHVERVLPLHDEVDQSPPTLLFTHPPPPPQDLFCCPEPDRRRAGAAAAGVQRDQETEGG